MFQHCLKPHAARMAGLGVIACLLAGTATCVAQEFAVETAREMFTAVGRDRLKNIYFNATHADICPQFTALLTSVGTEIRVVLPYLGAMRDVDSHATLGSDSDSVDLRFERPRCRFILTVKRFSGGGATAETAVPVRHGTLFAMQDGQASVSKGSPWVSTLNDIQSDKEHPNSAGRFSLLRGVFDTKDRFDFSGIIYFAPASVTVYLSNVPDELHIGAHKNTDIRAHEITISNQRARIYIAVTREINVDGTWTKLFEE